MGIFRDAYTTVMTQAGLLDRPAASPQAPAPATPPAAPAAFREAAGVTVDSDEDQWRPVGASREKNLDPITFERACKRSLYLWQTNPLANRIIELPLAYLLGKGVRLKSGDPEAQAVLDAHWNDCINRWAVKLEKRIRELLILGEQCWPVFVGDNGFVRVGYLDPRNIEKVVMDPDNAEQPIGVVARTSRPGRKKRYRVLINGPEQAFTARTQEIRTTFTDGDCFYARINDLCNSERGRGDLVAMIDWLDGYDEFLYGELERADFMRSFSWDVTLKGADQTLVDQRAKQIQAPRPGSVRVHNENELWTAVTPDLQAADGNTAARLMRNHILGGGTVPEHWYGGAADVNRATGESMAEPTQKILEMRQTAIGHVLVEVGAFVLRADWQLLDGSEPTKDQASILNALSVEWPEMTSRDTSRYAAALVQVITACTQAIDSGLLTEKTTLALIAVIAAQLGVDIDPAEELEKAREVLAARGGSKGDLFPGTQPHADFTAGNEAAPAGAAAGGNGQASG